tara:strand:- start:2534 stop:2776 length:243 start_codon:yes stop_codon:yes gene_type:complete
MPKLSPATRNPISVAHAASSDDDRQLLTVRQVAILDSTSEKTVRRAIKAGLLHVLRIGPGGRLLRISKAAHRAYRQAGML